jgi:hypothetical protein
MVILLETDSLCRIIEPPSTMIISGILLAGSLRCTKTISSLTMSKSRPNHCLISIPKEIYQERSRMISIISRSLAEDTEKAVVCPRILKGVFFNDIEIGGRTSGIEAATGRSGSSARSWQASRRNLYMSVFPTPYHDWKLTSFSLRVNSRNRNLPNPRL